VTSHARGHPAGRRALDSWFFLLSLPGANAPRAGSLRTCAPSSSTAAGRHGGAATAAEAVTRLPPAPASEARRKGSRAASRPAVLAVTRMSVEELDRRVGPAPAFTQSDNGEPACRLGTRAPASLSDHGSSSAHYAALEDRTVVNRIQGRCCRPRVDLHSAAGRVLCGYRSPPSAASAATATATAHSAAIFFTMPFQCLHSLIVQTFQPQSSNLFCFLDWMLDIAATKVNETIYMSLENHDETPKV